MTLPLWSLLPGSLPCGHVSAGQRCLDRVGVGALRPCLRSCLGGLFWDCFLVSSRSVVVEKTESSGLYPVAVTLVSSAGRCWHGLTSSGDRSPVRLEGPGSTLL